MNIIGHGSEWRKNYEKMEAMVGKYLDKYLYPNISVAFERNTNDETQKKGVDVSLTGNTQVIRIDEKATMNWVCTNLKKAALELRLLTIDDNNNEHEINGWLLSHGINTHIAIIWVDDADTKKLINNTNKGERYQLTGSGITDCTCAIINKQLILDELENSGWTINNLKIKADRIRTAYNTYGKEYWKHERCGKLDEDGVHFFIQTDEPEHAVNVQLSRNKLIELSDYTCRIKNNQLQEIHRRK